MGKVYFLTDGINIKIGYTKNKISDRIKQLNTGSANQIFEIGYIVGTMETEKMLHKKFEEFKIRSNGEWFVASDKLLNYLNKINQKPNVYIAKNELFDNKVMALLKI